MKQRRCPHCGHRLYSLNVCGGKLKHHECRFCGYGIKTQGVGKEQDKISLCEAMKNDGQENSL